MNIKNIENKLAKLRNNKPSLINIADIRALIDKVKRTN